MAAPCPDAAESGDSREPDVAEVIALEPRVGPAQSGNKVRVHVDALKPCAAYQVLFGGSVVGAARVADSVLVAHAPPHSGGNVNVVASYDGLHFTNSKAVFRYSTPCAKHTLTRSRCGVITVEMKVKSD